MGEFETRTALPPETRALSPGQWAVAVVVALASWQVGLAVARWLIATVNEQVIGGLESFPPGALSDVVWSIGYAMVAAVVAAPLAYGLVRVVLRRR